MLQLISHSLTGAPEYVSNENLFGAFPISAILLRPMGTVSEYVAFCTLQ